MRHKIKLSFALTIIAALAMAATATAAVTFDKDTGAGFVGKGDVQLVYGWGNAALQTNAASVQFRYVSTDVTEVTWECTNIRNETIQYRERTTTTDTQSVVDNIARERNQITGFNLTGYNGTPTQTSSSDGPALNSCPATASGWYLSSPAEDPVLISSDSHVQVSTDGSTWSNLNWPIPIPTTT
jgi:hypothetical protein